MARPPVMSLFFLPSSVAVAKAALIKIPKGRSNHCEFCQLFSALYTPPSSVASIHRGSIAVAA
eukprot:CAMPEP_0172910886 /NCGR_PEP_ID=MMETSP1075-20121228/185482_1 /TAXON_ID=2916 /ORGANISM="Ceratium fusus, Strain PA161109" /LENGTH=62 /DNA_ID=CAMNT_0013769091 /DNA_START=232 /DNA_END=417 /DNA_ORIENTATION=+